MNGAILSKVLSMSLIGSYSILVVLPARFLLKKVNRKYAYYLWLIVFVNLCVPFSFESPFSLVPRRVANISAVEQKLSVEPEKERIAAEPQMVVLSEEGTAIDTQAKEISASDRMESQKEDENAVFGKRQILIWAERIWLAGICLFALYSILSSVRLNRKIAESYAVALNKKERIVEMEGIASPFLWGILHPTIYLPENIEMEERRYIIAHEKCHRRRQDHLVKIVVYAVTVLHWFNPCVWLAYSLCCRDMEISCDEMVLERSGKNIRKAYAESLLKYAAKQNGYVMTPLTFGEPSVKPRIENVLKYRKKNVAFSIAAVILTVCIAAGLFLRPDESAREVSVNESEQSEEDATVTPDDFSETSPQVLNNGGEVIRVGSNLYYMNGQELYSDGQQLYISRQDDFGTWWIWRYAPDGGSFERLREGRILGARDEKAYIMRDEPDGLYIDCVNIEDGTEEVNILKQSIFKEQITSFYTTDHCLMFAAGAIEGSMGNFVGDFYFYDLVKGILTSKHLTDAKEFIGADAHIYYQKYFNPGDGGNELYRTNVMMDTEEQIGVSLELLAIDVENGQLLVKKDGQILRTQLDGSAEELLFDIVDIGWERIEGDRIQFSEVNIVGDMIYVKAEQWAYTGDNGWRDSLLQSEYLYIKSDGSDYGGWDPNALLAEQEEEFAYLTDAVPGTPCEDPAANGWNLYQWKDLRKQFSMWSYVTDPDMMDITYLLENTEHYKLYGSGDYQRMLLEYEGQYAEIFYPYTSNYMIPVDMVEYDYDSDGMPELAMKLNIKHGTGVYIDTFFMADMTSDGLYVYQFLEADMVAQTAGQLSCERTAHGLQAYVSGKQAGPALEDIPGQKPYERVSIGNQIQFYLGDERVHISSLLEFYTDDTHDLAFDSNAYDVRALVSYADGGQFVLTEFESINTSVDEMVRLYAEEYFMEEIRVIEVRYDVNGTSGRATAVVLPEGKDSYDYLEFELGGTWNNWTVENMYLQK